MGCGDAVVEALRILGHDVVSVKEINPSMEDPDILSLAVSESRLIVTMDKDFGELVYRSGLQHRGVLLLRLEDAMATEKVEVIKAIYRDHEKQLESAFSVYKLGRIRIRKIQ